MTDFNNPTYVHLNTLGSERLEKTCKEESINENLTDICQGRNINYSVDHLGTGCRRVTCPIWVCACLVLTGLLSGALIAALVTKVSRHEGVCDVSEILQALAQRGAAAAEKNNDATKVAISEAFSGSKVSPAHQENPLRNVTPDGAKSPPAETYNPTKPCKCDTDNTSGKYDPIGKGVKAEVVPDAPDTSGCSTEDHCLHDEGYQMIFRSTRGSGINLLNLWLHVTGMHEGNDMLKTTDENIPGAYKSSLVETHWNKIVKVKVAVYKDGQEAMFVVFNTTDTDKTSWFNQSRIICTNYLDLMTSSANYFSIEGHTHARISRRFYMWHRYGGCPKDLGWLMVADTDHNGGVCSFERNLPSLPAFIYSSLNVRASSHDLVQGDVLVIYALLCPEC